MDIALLIIEIVGFIAIVLWSYKVYKAKKELDLKTSVLNTDIEALIDQKNNLLQTIKNLLEQKIDAQNELKQTHIAIKKELDDARFKTQKILDELAQNTTLKTKEYNEVSAQIKELLIERDRLTSEVVAANDAISKLSATLEKLATQHREATKRQVEENEGRTMSWTIVDRELTELLEELKIKYPNLFDVFSAAEWTKIWQPKFQAMTNDISPSNDLCGIYRIWTIEPDGICKNYVGQARKIRERWSQHIKCMLGVAKSDNHKFYSAVKPYNAHFEIIETCSAEELNDKEHYWISFYNCVENGYNSKR